jgi:hypothetical protein
VRPSHPVASLDFFASGLPGVIFVTTQACVIRECHAQFEPFLLQATFTLIFLYHFLSIFVAHSRGQLDLGTNLDVGYLVRSIGLACVRMHPNLFLLSSTLLYFSLFAEFLHYQVAPRCYQDSATHIQLFTIKILRSFHFQNFLAITEILMIPYLFWTSFQQSRWDIAALGLMCCWFFGFVAYHASESHRFLWQILGSFLAFSESDGKERRRTLLANMTASYRSGRSSHSPLPHC